MSSVPLITPARPRPKNAHPVRFAKSKSDRARTAPTGRARHWSHPKCPVGSGAVSFAPGVALRAEVEKEPLGKRPRPRKRARAFGAENSPLDCFRAGSARAAPHPRLHRGCTQGVQAVTAVFRHATARFAPRCAPRLSLVFPVSKPHLGITGSDLRSDARRP
jgi:hypothetical protein